MKAGVIVLLSFWAVVAKKKDPVHVFGVRVGASISSRSEPS